ncbi:uncharacterized protein METZ01_LOCUS458875, partial [marine metagenome]
QEPGLARAVMLDGLLIHMALGLIDCLWMQAR